MDVSVVIVNYNGYDHTRNAILSVLQHSAESEIIVVDNCSTDGSGGLLQKEFHQLTVIIGDENKGFGFGCNRGAEAAKGKYLFFLNNDTLLSEDTPAILASFLEKDPTVAACGPKLLNPDGTFQVSFGLDPSLVNEWIVRGWQRPRKGAREAIMSSVERRYAHAKVDWVTGAALMVRKDVFQKLNGFDESYFMYFEDADLCKRIRILGFDIFYYAQASLTHFAGLSVKERKTEVSVEYRRSQLRFYDKFHSLAERICLRLFLLVKFSARLIDVKQRKASVAVIMLLFNSHGK
jgi:GT2 family glycosyltransferase